jgi:hypothetical protein
VIRGRYPLGITRMQLRKKEAECFKNEKPTSVHKKLLQGMCPPNTNSFTRSSQEGNIRKLSRDIIVFIPTFCNLISKVLGLIMIVPSSGFMCEIQTTDVLTVRECEFSHTKVVTDDTCVR